MPRSGPLPQIGAQGAVVIDGQSLNLVPGTYSVEEAPRFGEKISTGDLRYADFNPYESAHSVSALIGGYGLRDYTDLPPPSPEQPEQGLTRYLESDGCDCRDGKIILGPYKRPIVLTGATETPVWIGEFPVAYGRGAYGGQRILLCIAGTKIFVINTDYTATDTGLTLPASARKGAVAVFGSKLIIGFGANAYGVYTEDLAAYNNVTQGLAEGIVTRNPIYIFEVTVDQAAVYVAGGPSKLNVNTITSSADGGTEYDTNLTICGGDDSSITSLAPGGGIYSVMVGKETELGAVDLQGIYRTLAPYDSRRTTNSNFMRWALGRGEREDQGPMAVFFPRDDSLWMYQPRTQSMRDVSPWGEPGIRPLNVRGIPTAFQGAARWGYWTLTNADTGESYLVAREHRTGAHHPIASLGVNDVQVIGYSALLDGSPVIYVGVGTSILAMHQPPDGSYPPDCSDYLYTAEGNLDLPAITLNFPDELKISFHVRVVAANLLPGVRTVEVLYAYDDDTTYTSLGFISESPAGEVSFPTSESARRIKIRFTLRTTDITTTPEIQGVSVRLSLNSKLYRIWTFQTYLPASTQQFGSADLKNAFTLINDLWRAREDGIPISFIDRWDVPWTVRPLRIKETEVISEPDKTPETVLDLALLQFAPGAGNLIYDDAASIYDNEDERYG